MHKYEAFYGKQYVGNLNFAFRVLNGDPKPVLIRIKTGTLEETRIKGYMCRFVIGLPEVLMKLMYESGIGEKGSLGFGMVKLIEN
jgi:CRISPR-associated endoribonuclease Cas6